LQHRRVGVRTVARAAGSERLALLQALAQNPGENALRVLEFLREEDARRAANRARQDRRGWIAGGLIMMAVGAGLGGMLLEIGDRGDWAVGLIPFMIGCVLVPVGALIRPGVPSVESNEGVSGCDKCNGRRAVRCLRQ